MPIVDVERLMAAVRATDRLPKERIDEVRASGAVLYEYVGGSHAYGTSIPTSDVDLRGVFCLPIDEYLSTKPVAEAITDQREVEGKKQNDDSFFTLRRFFELLKGANPNVMESLWIPDDCLVSRSPEFDVLVANRDLFVSQACLKSHFGYANGQIAKATGKNKKVNNPWPKERPKKLDFCRVIPFVMDCPLWTITACVPGRPIPLRELADANLAHCHVASVEHMPHGYRLYHYGPSAKGVFRGDDMLACESIPIEDERRRFVGILLYSEPEYERAIKEWKSYWEWVENRNPNRWVAKEGEKVDCEHKNMMHCMRLLMSGIHLLRHGFPLVRVSGKDRDLLMEIRLGKRKYAELMPEVERRVAEMEAEALTSTIPKSVDGAKLDALYAEVSAMAWDRLFGKRVVRSAQAPGVVIR